VWQGKERQQKAGQGKARLDRTGHAGQDKARQDKAREIKHGKTDE
jgi:hypothetical protein